MSDFRAPWRETKEADGCRRTLSKSQRKSYIAAVNCMRSTPPMHNTTEIPAVKNLFDDFLAVHVFQTPYIHNTVSLIIPHGPLGRAPADRRRVPS